jgi:hemoglobin
MKKDIVSIKDIEQLVDAFYGKVQADGLIGYIFTDIAKVNWQEHLPRMYHFFENLLFYTGSYTGNPLELHKHISRLFPLTAAHFERWEQLFTQTVDELFAGEKATLAKQRAKSISAVLQLKIIKEGAAANKIF